MSSYLDKKYTWICNNCGNLIAHKRKSDLDICDKCMNNNWKKQGVINYRDVESNLKYYKKKIENDNIVRYYNEELETEHIFFLKNIIGEKETQIIFNLFKGITNGKIYKIDIFIERDLELFTPVFTSNLILLAIKFSKSLRIRLFLQYKNAITYQILQTISGDTYLNNFLIFTGDLKKGLFFEQGLDDRKSVAYLRSILITPENFKDYFLNDKDHDKLLIKYRELLIHHTDLIKYDLKIPEKDSYYKEKMNVLFEKLDKKPLFFKMLLRLLYMNLINWKGEKENWINAHLNISSLEKSGALAFKQRKNVDDFVRNIFGIYQFTESIFPGIYEIAKNTQEHSTNHRGVVSVRIFDAQKINIIKNTNKERWLKYFKSSKLTSVGKFLDISIIDDGKMGIFDTLFNSFDTNQLSSLAKESGRKPFVEDLRQLTKILKDDKTNISEELYFRLFQLSFSDRDKRSFLFQLKKASAGYGLMVFTSNLFENRGCYNVISYSPKRNISYGFFKDFKEDYIPYSETNLQKGTHYNFIFPIIPKGASKITNNAYLPQKGPSDEDIFKPLSNYSFETREGIEKKLPYGIIYKRNKILYKNKRVFDAYDFSNSNESIDRSDLLRFLAEINLSDEQESNIIIYNFNYQTLVDLVDLLRIIYKYFHNTFWSDPRENSHRILFYCRNYETRLISAFLLGGKSISSLIAANRQISYYQYVDIPDEGKLEEIRNSEKKDISQELECILKPPFFINKHPIFFDMILKATKYHTIFEANVHEVLTREID